MGAQCALEAHANPNAHSDPVGFTALHICVSQGHFAVAQLLLEYDANVSESSNALGLTPLSAACLAGDSSAVKLLICATAHLDGVEAAAAMEQKQSMKGKRRH